MACWRRERLLLIISPVLLICRDTDIIIVHVGETPHHWLMMTLPAIVNDGEATPLATRAGLRCFDNNVVVAPLLCHGILN